MQRRLLSALLLCASACSPAPDGPPDETPPPALPNRCRTTPPWTPTEPAFREVTEQWGLAALRVEGTRLSAADMDGDGRIDLVVRRGGVLSDDFASEGKRHTWVLKNDGTRFVDVTEASGLLARRGEEPKGGRPAEVWAFADVDNDGHVDVYTGIGTADAGKSLGETSEILLNQGDGTFALTPDSNPVRRAQGIDSPASAAFVDFDRDGIVDLWVPQHGYDRNGFTFAQDRLWKGRGDGTFADVTTDAGLETTDWVRLDDINEGRAHSRAWSGAACDLNGDGLPDLLAASYGRAPNHLWQAERRADGSVGFINRSVDSGYAYDDDFTWEDNEFARCFCMKNPSAAGCGAVAPPNIACTQDNWSHSTDREPFRLGGNSGTTVCADLDGDGHIDLVTTEIKHWWAGSGADGAEILLNTGERDVRFTRPGRDATGLVIPHVTTGGWDEGIMTAAVFDFDNDGRPDIYLGGSDYAGNRGMLFHQQAGAFRFELLSPETSIDHARSHGVVVADFDGDGDEDIIVGHSRSRCDANAPADCYPTGQVRFFENLAGDRGNFIQLELEGTGPMNRSAIGARVTVEANGRTQTKEVGGGYGHYGQQDSPVLHFGLGTACEADVLIRWPSNAGHADALKLAAGYRYRLRPGELPVAQGIDD